MPFRRPGVSAITDCRIVIHGPEETNTISPQLCGTTTGQFLVVSSRHQGKISVSSLSSNSDGIIQKTSRSPSRIIPSPRINVEELDLNVRKLFATMDVNGNGFITLREFERHLALCGVQLGWEAVEQLYILILCPLAAAGSSRTACLANRKVSVAWTLTLN
jgi:hypothetical protein